MACASLKFDRWHLHSLACGMTGGERGGAAYLGEGTMAAPRMPP